MKPKFMLIVIFLLAVAGASLAFKVKFATAKFCTTAATTTVQNGPLVCPVNATCPILVSFTTTVTTSPRDPRIRCYTTYSTNAAGQPTCLVDGLAFECDRTTAFQTIETN